MWNGWSNQNLHIQRAPLLVSAKQKENYICSRAGEGPINPSNPGKPASLTTGSATASLSIPPVFVLCSPLALSTYRSGTHQLSPSAWTSWKVWLPFCGRFPAHIFYVSFLDYTFFSKHLQISPFTYRVSEGMYHLLEGMHSPKAFPMVPWPHLSTYFSPRKKNTIQTSLPCLWCLQISKLYTKHPFRIATSMQGRACQGWEGRVATLHCVPGTFCWLMVPRGCWCVYRQLLGYLYSHCWWS